MMSQAQDSPLLQLPEVALEKIFSFLTFDEIARNRIVCRKFNEMGGKLLTRGFMQLEKRNAFMYRKVKQALPRRESERKNHPLAKYCDVLQSVETRMSMLNMTYMRYIENQLVCFIPGKVLDETKRILDLMKNQVLPKCPQFLQELRDLSSMAIEHFDEHIMPGCKEQLEQRTGVSLRHLSAADGRSRILVQPHVPGTLTNELRKLKRFTKNHKVVITYLTQTTQELCSKMRKQNIKLRVQASKLREQDRTLQQQTAKISEQNAALTDIKKHIEEWEQKYKDFTTELIRARDDILHKGSATIGPMLSPPVPSSSSSQSSPFRSNIKPRTAAILPKSYLGLDLERKRKSMVNLEVPLKRNRGSSVPSPPKLRVQDVSLNIPDLDSFNDKTSRSCDSEGGTDPPRGEEGEVLSSLLDGLVSGGTQLNRKRKMVEDIDLK